MVNNHCSNSMQNLSDVMDLLPISKIHVFCNFLFRINNIVNESVKLI